MTFRQYAYDKTMVHKKYTQQILYLDVFIEHKAAAKHNMRLKHFIPHGKGYTQYFLTENEAASQAVQPLESASTVQMEFFFEVQ